MLASCFQKLVACRGYLAHQFICRTITTNRALRQAETAAVEPVKKQDDEDQEQPLNTYPENHPGLMEFFDDPENWTESEVKSGRPWRIDELRIKSNSDLHKLWYVLLKERNMLLTMEENCKAEARLFPSPERVEKVEESMELLEKVVRERNKAYWEAEVGEGRTGERRCAFRKDQFGRFMWLKCSEHLLPYYLNTKWRQIWGPGRGKDVDDFIQKYREQKINNARKTLLKQAYTVRQILRKFPDVDLDYLQEKYPKVPVQYMKENHARYRDRFYVSSGTWSGR